LFAGIGWIVFNLAVPYIKAPPAGWQIWPCLFVQKVGPKLISALMFHVNYHADAYLIGVEGLKPHCDWQQQLPEDAPNHLFVQCSSNQN